MRLLQSAILLIACIVSAVSAAEVSLETELKVSGPQVSIRAPLGFGYRPGYAFPLQIRVYNPGAEFRAEIFVQEGDGPQSGFFEPDARTIPAGATQQFTILARAPAVTANLSVILRSVLPGSTVKPELFRASLARILKPLPPDARIVLVCGAGFAPHAQDAEISAVTAKDFPDQAWMYERASIGSCSATAASAAQVPTRKLR